jgi:hypothetical protein
MAHERVWMEVRRQSWLNGNNSEKEEIKKKREKNERKC